MAKTLMEWFFLLVAAFSFGYSRIYIDGPKQQPLVLLMGGVWPR